MPSLPFTASLSRRLALIALAAGAAPAFAQTQTAPPANGQLPQTIPGLDNFTIAPRTPAPLPLPVPTPTPTPSPAQVVPIHPLPSPTPTPRASRTPATRPTPAPAPSPAATPTPASTATTPPVVAATPAAQASPAPAPAPTLVPATAAPRHSLLWIALFIALLLFPAFGVVAWFLRRGQWSSAAPAEVADDDDDDWIAPDQVAPPSPPPPPAPAPVAPPRHLPGASARPRLEIGFAPRSAGINGANAAVDYDLLIRNAGDAPAEQVQLRVDLITAGDAHDAELQARLGQPIEQPMIAPFTLAAGQARPIRALAQLPRSAITVVTVQGRPMFVPIVAIDLRYRWATGEGQTAQSFVIGIAPKQGERMRPFWLDVPPRMYDTVTARPHSVEAKR